jgi:hypothetical protein
VIKEVRSKFAKKPKVLKSNPKALNSEELKLQEPVNKNRKKYRNSDLTELNRDFMTAEHTGNFDNLAQSCSSLDKIHEGTKK